MTKKHLFRNSAHWAKTRRRKLGSQHLFSQYMLQGQMHEQTFLAMLNAFQTELRRLQARYMPLDQRLIALRNLQQQFDDCLTELCQQQQLQLTLPMRLALGAARIRWFFVYQGPQLRQGWQQAAQGFRSFSDPR